jgi:hypothetical protein
MNQNYAHANAAFLQAQINWLGHNIKVAVLSPSYPGGSSSIANHQYYSDIAAYVLTGSTPIKTLTNKTVSVGGAYGVAGADPTTFGSLTSGQIMGFYAFFRDPDANNTDGAPASGNQGSAQLIHLIDSAFGIGSGTNGGDVIVAWNAAGIFCL